MRRDRLQAQRGQVVLEYFVIFTLLAMVTLIGLTRFDDDIKANLEGYFRAAVASLSQ